MSKRTPTKKTKPRSPKKPSASASVISKPAKRRRHVNRTFKAIMENSDTEESSEDEATAIQNKFRRGKEAVQRSLRTSRATRSASDGYLFKNNSTERTQEQTKRDKVASALSKEWLPRKLSADGRERLNLEPRGIQNPGVHCYLNAMLQTLMHVPIFLNWIRTHVPESDCLVYKPKKKSSPAPSPKVEYCTRCELKRLVEEYWGPTSPSEPISEHSPALLGLKSNVWQHTHLVETNQEDTQEVLMFLTNETYGLAKGVDSWKTQFDTIFQFHNVPFRTCSRCGVEREHTSATNNQWEVAVAESHTTLAEAIEASFESHLGDYRCLTPGCAESIQGKSGPPQYGRYVIRAAPRVLYIHLIIFGYNLMEGSSKITHALRIGEELDLTRYQEKNMAPLKYQLSGVVAHSGATANSGHYVACVRGPDDIWHISDDVWKERVEREKFTANPETKPEGKPKPKEKEGQSKEGEGQSKEEEGQSKKGKQEPKEEKKDGTEYNVYILTYIRDEKP